MTFPPFDRDLEFSGRPGTDGEPERSRTGLRVAAVVVVALLIGAAGYYYFLMGRDDLPPPRQVRDLQIVTIVPPPPPPPPPPPQQMPEQQMIEQPKMAEPEMKPEKPDDRPKDKPPDDAKNDEPPGPLALDSKVQGPGDIFNLGGKEGGNPYGGGGGGGSRWGWYAGKIETQIQAALLANPKTRNAVMRAEVRLWADGSGRVTRVTLTPSTGDAGLDSVIRDEVIGRLTLSEPPPKDMPMPIVTRITERRPG